VAAMDHAHTGAGKVRVGFFSFTEVTDPDQHRAYNEWHQLDHMPEQFPLAGVAWGQRWVSTPACRAARAVDEAPLRPVHYMTLYLMTDPVEETLDSFAALGRRLRQLGRFHEHRTSHLSGPWSVVGALAADRVLVSGAAVPFRPNTGVYVVVEAPVDDEPDVGARAVPARADVAELLAVDGVAGVWSFAPLARYGRWDPGGHRITVCYLDGDVMTAAAGLGSIVDQGATGTSRRFEAVLAGPFETISPWRWDWFEGS